MKGRRTEVAVNLAVARCLMKIRPRWDMDAENTGVEKGKETPWWWTRSRRTCSCSPIADRTQCRSMGGAHGRMCGIPLADTAQTRQDAG